MFFSKSLKSISNLNHCFFSRKNGVSKGIYNSLNCGLGSKDNKDDVKKNINIVSKKLNSKDGLIVTLNQMHTNKVVYFDDRNKIKEKITGDAIVTNLENLGIAVLTADCVPLLFCDPKKRLIGCVHAGWKGAFKGIIENTIEKFLEKNCKLKDIVVAIGPCIEQSNYEVGDDFYNKFISETEKNRKFFIILKNKKYLFNIRRYIEDKLVKSGIKNIDNIEMDTFSDRENFFSYRRSIIENDEDYGRCISVIFMT